MYNKAFIRQ